MWKWTKIYIIHENSAQRIQMTLFFLCIPAISLTHLFGRADTAVVKQFFSSFTFTLRATHPMCLASFSSYCEHWNSNHTLQINWHGSCENVSSCEMIWFNFYIFLPPPIMMITLVAENFELSRRLEELSTGLSTPPHICMFTLWKTSHL